MFFTRDIGIDLGTANTLVYMKGRGIIIREPSVVAVDVGSDKVRCVGEAAKEVIGRTPDSVAVVRPLRDGVIADFDITISMLEDLIRRATGSSLLIRPRVVICVPSGVTGVERRAVRDVTEQAGARKVLVIEEPMAAALGAGLTALLGAARLLRGLARTRALPLPHVSHRGAVTIATAASIATAAPIAAP